MFFTADTALAGAAERPPWESGEENVSRFPSGICLNLKADDRSKVFQMAHIESSSSRVVNRALFSSCADLQPLLPSHYKLCKGGLCNHGNQHHSWPIVVVQ